MYLFMKAPFIASVLIILDMLCIIGFVRARSIVKRYMDRLAMYQRRKQNVLTNISAYMATLGTGDINVPINYWRATVGMGAATITFILIAAH